VHLKCIEFVWISLAANNLTLALGRRKRQQAAGRGRRGDGGLGAGTLKPKGADS